MSLRVSVLILASILGGCGLVTGEADAVLGQPDLISHVVNNPKVSIDGRLNLPLGAAVAPASGTEPGRLYVADPGNHRVLSWPSASAFASGDPADRVLGQSDMNGMQANEGGGPTRVSLKAPWGVTVAAGNVYVADTGNNRVLVYTMPIVSHQAAARVYGQYNFTSNEINGAGNESGLNQPMAVAAGPDGLYVADTGNHRVLLFRSAVNALPPVVIGQRDFATHTANEGNPGPLATSFWAPTGLVVSTGGDLWVADNLNHRVLRFSGPHLSNHPAADLVLGQRDFVSRQEYADFQVRGSTLRFPWGVALDPGGNLYVSDRSANRVLRFLAPFSIQMNADRVLGQPNLSHALANSGGVNGKGLSRPTGLAVNEANGALIVADTGNHRMLRYNYFHVAGDNLPDTVYTGGCQKPGPNLGVICIPSGIAVDLNGRVFVVNHGGSRVLSWANLEAFDAGLGPDAVIGTPDFDQPAVGVSERSLNHPTAVVTDAAGNLWVADTGNHRVLRFPGPIQANTKGPAADLLIGQVDFTKSKPNRGGTVSGDGFDAPQGIATDDTGRVYVADTNNHRVLVFRGIELKAPYAAVVIGQTQLTFTSNDKNRGSVVSDAFGFDSPQGVAVGPGCDLFVADRNNNRVLVFRQVCNNHYKGEPADWVLGQTGMVNQAKQNQGRQYPDATTLGPPTDVSIDIARRLLYVADPNNSRVLQYRLPLVGNGQAAVRVFGQQDFKSTGARYGLGGITMPGQGCIILGGVAVDKVGNVLVADACRSAVWKYDVPAN